MTSAWCQTPQDTAQPPDKSADTKAPDAKPIPALNPYARYDFQGEVTFILQNLSGFRSLYQRPNSFRSRNETELSDTYEMFIGARVIKNLEVYVDPEIAWGNGLSNGLGLAGYVNGDIIGQPTLRPYPFLARYFVRWRIQMPHVGNHPGGEQDKTEQAGRAPNVIADTIPVHRLVVQVGKFAISDVFDYNSYANNPRTQFINKALTNNPAYDYAQETRGMSLGGSIAWINPTFAVRFGTFAMPTSAGGPDLAYNLSNNHSEQLEIEIHRQLLGASKPPFIVRLLGYRNVGDMGVYADALNTNMVGQAPDIASVRKQGSVKYGFGLNAEQPLADGGNTGLFARLGWNNGATESFSFIEADSSLSLGGQLSGSHWHRKDDRIGLAVVQSDISNSHRAYLAAGGLGLSVGDGALNYGSERIAEVYYSYQVYRAVSLSLDYQGIVNPGFNRDRGPASILGLRAHMTF